MRCYKFSFSRVLMMGVLFLNMSCTDKLIDTPKESQNNAVEFLTKTINPKEYQQYLVSDTDVVAYVHYLGTIEDSKHGNVVSVTPVEQDGQVVYTILNMENGWMLLSSDKRGPIILAESPSGTFSLDVLDENKQSWINTLIDDIKYRWNFPEEYYQKGGDRVQLYEKECVEEWKAINADFDFIQKNALKTKGGGLIPSGHYELIHTYYTHETINMLPHLLTTTWRQHDPFNLYFPLKQDSLYARCPAGCVPIAASQVLFYLHTKLGKPVLSPSDGYCIGDENDFSRGFYDYLTTTWAGMYNSTDPNHYAALLIGRVSQMLGMDDNHHITSTGSSAATSDLPSCVFEPLGIGSTYSSSYNADTVYQNLKVGLPVIFAAHRYENLFNWPGHCFVIDGYEDYVTKTHYVYSWVYDYIPDPGGGDPFVPIPPDDYEEVYITSRELQWFHLNWGDGASDSAQYSTNGNWSYGNLSPYQYLKRMVYGFYVLEE